MHKKKGFASLATQEPENWWVTVAVGCLCRPTSNSKHMELHSMGILHPLPCICACAVIKLLPQHVHLCEAGRAAVPPEPWRVQRGVAVLG
jgi:hypothetical protein